jgi:hypothetical protein
MTPRELVAAVAKQTGVHVGSVTLHDRNLLVAGLRTEGQRGRGSSRVTFLDAAHLLIAVAASRSVKDSAAIVGAYAGLEAGAYLFPAGDEGEGRGKTLADAIAGLLEAVPAGRSQNSGASPSPISVSLYGPAPRASIEWMRRGEVDRLDYVMIDSAEPRIWRKEYLPDARGPRKYPDLADLQFISRFSQITLREVGKLLRA